MSIKEFFIKVYLPFFLVLIEEGIEDQRLIEIISQNRDESSTLTDTEGSSMSSPNHQTYTQIEIFWSDLTFNIASGS